MKRASQRVVLGSFAFLLTAIPALAHHTIAAEFDTRDTVTLTGVFTKIDWINPHIYFYIDAKDNGGKVAKWAMESYPTGFFHRAGITRDLFKLGDTVTVTLYRPKRWNAELGVFERNDLTWGPKN